MRSTTTANGRRAADALGRTGPPLALMAVLVGAWELVVRLRLVDDAVVPAPSQAAAALVEHAGSLTRHAATTMAETLIGLGIGAVLGIATAVLICASGFARRAVEPLLVVIQTIPPIVLTPILVLIFGFGWTPRVIVVVLIVFFPVAIAATGGFLGADPDRIAAVRSLGGSTRQVWRHVIVPGGAPAIADGIRISAAYSVAGAAIAEQIGGARSGLGLFIARSQRNFQADQVMAAVIVIAVLSLVVYGLVGLAARRALPWYRPTRHKEAT